MVIGREVLGVPVGIAVTPTQPPAPQEMNICGWILNMQVPLDSGFSLAVVPVAPSQMPVVVVIWIFLNDIWPRSKRVLHKLSEMCMVLMTELGP